MTTNSRVTGLARQAFGEAVAGAITIHRVAALEFHVAAAGLWSIGYADLHFRQLDALLAAAREEDGSGGGVRVLVDLREAAVQSPATADRVKFWTGSIYKPRDRVAMLVASSLVKMQMRRVAAIATRELFLSENAALTWLQAA